MSEKVKKESPPRVDKVAEYKALVKELQELLKEREGILMSAQALADRINAKQAEVNAAFEAL